MCIRVLCTNTSRSRAKEDSTTQWKERKMGVFRTVMYRQRGVGLCSDRHGPGRKGRREKGKREKRKGKREKRKERGQKTRDKRQKKGRERNARK